MLNENTDFKELQTTIKEQIFDPQLDQYLNELLPCEEMKEVTLLPNQFYYIIRTIDSKCIYVSPEMETIMGYSADEWQIDFILDTIHPDDREIVEKAIVASYKIGQSSLVKPAYSSALMINYRMRKKDGTYLHILRYGSILKCDKTEKMIYNKSLCTDISDYKRDNQISVKIFNGNEELFHLCSEDKQLQRRLLSRRENEITNLICQNMSSYEIAKQLHLSKHTIDTHRRNILKKLDLKNTKELFFRIAME